MNPYWNWLDKHGGQRILQFNQWLQLMRIFKCKKNNIWLVVEEKHPSEKYEFVNWDDSSQYMEK